jgi:hypothetical protein
MISICIIRLDILYSMKIGILMFKYDIKTKLSDRRSKKKVWTSETWDQISIQPPSTVRWLGNICTPYLTWLTLLLSAFWKNMVQQAKVQSETTCKCKMQQDRAKLIRTRVAALPLQSALRAICWHNVTTSCFMTETLQFNQP